MIQSSFLIKAATRRSGRSICAYGLESPSAALETIGYTRFGVRPPRINSAGNRGLMKWLSLMLFLPTLGAQTVINCPSGFSSSGSCGVGNNPNQVFIFVTQIPGAALSGSSVLLVPTEAGHNATSLTYQTAVNVQAFTATFTFVPDGENLAFVLNNTNNYPGFQGGAFAQGAGCEAGFYQSFPNNSPAAEPNNVFALEFDQFSSLTNVNPYTFTYSSVQIYQGNNTGSEYGAQSPCIPPYAADPVPSKISTSPVPLNSPVGTYSTTTGDTYSATIAYNGSSLTLNLYDVTAGGSCPGASCFSYTWTGVNIPSIVGGMNTAYVGITAGSDAANPGPLYIKSFTYTQGLVLAPVLVSASVR